jgi:glutamate 5-kinase
LARQRRAGRDVVLVSSGAVGMGMRLLGLRQRPRSLGLRQACAAVGQGHLMGLYYAKAFAGPSAWSQPRFC